ncbi:MAG: hypothetical protein RL341_116 [Pseudomonadota bacterium]|jgi:hypothetical protein
MSTSSSSTDRQATTTLAHALHQGRQTLAQQLPPPYVQSTVLAALPPRAARQRATLAGWIEERTLGWIISGGQVRQARIASLALIVGVLAGGAALLLGQAAQSGARAATQVATSFMPLVGSERMSTQSLGWVVATDVPRASLSAMGLPYDPARAGDTVRAEMLVNPSGEVLAVRFVQ